MFTFFLIVQADITATGRAKGLETLNSLGFIVFIVGLLLIYLLVAHWYRMKAKVDKRQKSKERNVKPGREDGDMLTQLEFMSRDELKAMILSERAKNADKAVEAIGVGSTGAHPETTDGPNIAQVDEKIVTPAGSAGQAAPVKNPYSDKVERVPTFEELQDELKKTSRRI